MNMDPLMEVGYNICKKEFDEKLKKFKEAKLEPQNTKNINDFINIKGINSLIIIDKLNINNINLNLMFYEYTNDFILYNEMQEEEERFKNDTIKVQH